MNRRRRPKYICMLTCDSRNAHSRMPMQVASCRLDISLLTHCSPSLRAFDNADKSVDPESGSSRPLCQLAVGRGIIRESALPRGTRFAHEQSQTKSVGLLSTSTLCSRLLPHLKLLANHGLSGLQPAGRYPNGDVRKALCPRGGVVTVKLRINAKLRKLQTVVTGGDVGFVHESRRTGARCNEGLRQRAEPRWHPLGADGRRSATIAG